MRKRNMAVCMFWLLTYVGQGLDLAVGNRPAIIVQGTQGLDYRHGSNSIRKKNEPNSIGSNLLQFRIYPSEGSHRDDLSNWLVFNDEPRISSWSPAGILIDDMVKEPRELQSVFFALSPTVLNVLYSDYMTSQTSTHAIAVQPVVHDDNNLHLHGGRPQHQRPKKRRMLGCRHPIKGTLSLPILVCDGKKNTAAAAAAILQDPSRQSNYHDDLYEQRFNTATSTKTDLARADGIPRDGISNGGFIPRPLVYEANKLPGKRNQISVGRRSADVPAESPGHQAQASATSSTTSTGASIASQFMLRSIRGSIQYDVPQIECPVSEDGMERFACPTADRMGRYHCIDDHVLCDGFIDCPTGEDEDRQACMFYKTVSKII
ncbi:hypothetical protein EAI_04578 [Harpegnathos saltator]|uniref:Uncharacterized protein n=1 Tax=Harpegnathos saltator TaxID=610380 RepID=E2C346_HARSA|nr:hypothetical protein EAI_04578 [Harpegnathos saltator]